MADPIKATLNWIHLNPLGSDLISQCISSATHMSPLFIDVPSASPFAVSFLFPWTFLLWQHYFYHGFHNLLLVMRYTKAPPLVTLGLRRKSPDL